MSIVCMLVLHAANMQSFNATIQGHRIGTRTIHTLRPLRGTALLGALDGAVVVRLLQHQSALASCVWVW